jgi:hypothetical protein
MPTDQDLIEIVEEIIETNDLTTAAAVLVEIIQNTLNTGFVMEAYYDKGNDEIKKIIDVACERHFG